MDLLLTYFTTNAGMLYQEIILTALQEYKGEYNQRGNKCRADVVNDIINKIKFKQEAEE